MDPHMPLSNECTLPGNRQVHCSVWLGAGASKGCRDWLRLAGGFEVGVAGRQISVPLGAQRLLAYLAIADRQVSRSRCAGELWQSDAPQRARHNLRTTLWRVNRFCGRLVVSEQDRLSLAKTIEVDTGEPAQLSRRLARADDLGDHAAMATIVTEPTLLPTWDDTWIVIERERLRLLWLHALEEAARELAPQRPSAALLAAMAAVRIEPLQESAWRMVVAINLQEGNVASAHRAYTAYRSMLAHELGVHPSALMEDLLAGSKDLGLMLHR
jgi:DNA-binding SARP family transcriptional activator